MSIRHNARSGFSTSSGLFRVLAWPYLFKNFTLRDLVAFSGNLWSPGPYRLLHAGEDRIKGHVRQYTDQPCGR
ncbi:phage portal protein family protein [unidentified bacterial endosymbiont]|uniref:phage portal protein family protein n=1 Tax=unidentified bacterial endosymbiont TaxID=2355 RepID=UPI003F519F3A